MMERKFTKTKYFYNNRYKACKTSGFQGGVVIFIKKRLLGFLWWVYVKDRDGNPITFNHYECAEAFMEGRIKYYDHHKKKHVNDKWYVEKQTEDDVIENISQRIKQMHGETPDYDCVKKAWEFEGKNYIHIAVKFASLWHFIYKHNKVKLWTEIK